MINHLCCRSRSATRDRWSRSASSWWFSTRRLTWVSCHRICSSRFLTSRAWLDRPGVVVQGAANKIVPITVVTRMAMAMSPRLMLFCDPGLDSEWLNIMNMMCVCVNYKYWFFLFFVECFIWFNKLVSLPLIYTKWDFVYFKGEL